MEKLREWFAKAREKLRGWKTAIVSAVVMMASVIDLSDIKDILPEGHRGDILLFAVGMMFLYLRHVTDGKPGWKK